MSRGGARRAARRRRDRADETAPPSGEAIAPRPPRRHSAGLVALLFHLWACSLLAFDWCREQLFPPGGRSHLVLVLPLFAGAAIAAGLAWHWRGRHGPGVGGRVVHGLGLASGLLGVTALTWGLWLAPRLLTAERVAQQVDALRQLERVAAALEQHRLERGTYPIGRGVEVLSVALAPEFLTQPVEADPWGGALHYRSAAQGSDYLLLSRGRDGVQDRPDFDYLENVELAAGDDLAFRTGRLVAGGEDS